MSLYDGVKGDKANNNEPCFPISCDVCVKGEMGFCQRKVSRGRRRAVNKLTRDTVLIIFIIAHMEAQAKLPIHSTWPGSSYGTLYTAVQSQKAVSAYFTSKQILFFVFARWYSNYVIILNDSYTRTTAALREWILTLCQN